MNYRKYYIICLLFILVLNISEAQRWRLTRYEYTFSIGTGVGQNDIVGVGKYTPDNWFGLEEALAFRNMGLTGSVGFRYRITEKSSLKVSLDGGLLRGKDPKSRGESNIRKFNTYIFEPSLQYEYSLIKESIIGSRYHIMDYRGGISSKARRNTMSLYLFGGIGSALFKANPNEVARLDHPYNEGFNKILIIPAGLGIKYLVSNKNSIGVEIGGRLTLLDGADFLDGIQPIVSKSNDIYGLINVFWAHKLRASRKGLPVLRRE